MKFKTTVIGFVGLLALAAMMNPDPIHASCDFEVAGDLNNDCRVDFEDFAIFASNWLVDCNVDPQHPGCVPITPSPVISWVYIDDPGVPPDYEGFTGEMSKYPTTNIQYAQYLNDALASEHIEIDGNYVKGTSGAYSGWYYYRLDGPGVSTAGATNGGASRIKYSGGSFTVDSGFENHPLTYVSWYGAMAFAEYYGWHLPTEDEWEAVASYTDGRTYATGNSLYDSQKFFANYQANGSDGYPPNDLPYHDWVEHGTSEVGYFGTFGYGLADMAGNVWEWTSSSGGPQHSYRIIHGGSWYNNDDYCIVSNRHYTNPDFIYTNVGFRVCR